MIGFILFFLLIFIISVLVSGSRKKRAAYQELPSDLRREKLEAQNDRTLKAKQELSQAVQGLVDSLGRMAKAAEADDNKSEFIIDVSGTYDLKPHYDTNTVVVSEYLHTSYYPEEYKLGKRYKDQLGLNTQDVGLLNKFNHFSNVFVAIDGCCVETIKLYLAAIKKVNNRLKKNDTSIAKQVKNLQQVRRKGDSSGDQFYMSFLDQKIEEDLYLTIFKRAENVVRDVWGHRRKINGDFPHGEQLGQLFNTHLGNVLDIELDLLRTSVGLPDLATELELNAQNVNRWKDKIEVFNQIFKEGSHSLEDAYVYIKNIHELAASNARNPQLENIYFESSKMLAGYHPIESLQLYLHYLNCDMQSARFDNKKFSKTIQKGLFKTNEQLHAFELIVSDFIKGKNLDAALVAVTQIYQPKRKKISLDREMISEVQKQDNETVGLLNEYLKDEYEDEHVVVKMEEVSSEELQLDILNKNASEIVSPYLTSISLNDMQLDVLRLFEERSLIVSKDDLGVYCKERGFFSGQVVNSINESFYETLDDLLIEEDDNAYKMEISYHQKILNQ